MTRPVLWAVGLALLAVGAYFGFEARRLGQLRQAVVAHQAHAPTNPPDPEVSDHLAPEQADLEERQRRSLVVAIALGLLGACSGLAAELSSREQR